MTFTRAICNLRWVLLIVGAVPIQSARSDPSSNTNNQPFRQPAKTGSAVTIVSRAQSPETEASTGPNAAHNQSFDPSLVSAETKEFPDVPPAPHCPDITNPAWPNPLTTTPQNSSTYMPVLGAGQGALTAQNMAPAFFGDFFNGSGTQITAPGGVLQNPTSDPNWSPLAVQLIDNANHVYYRSLDILNGTNPTNTFAYSLNSNYSNNSYTVTTTNPGFHYQDGFSFYKAAWNGTGSNYSTTFSAPNLVAAQNIALITSNSAVETGRPINWQNGDTLAEIKQLSGPDGNRAVTPGGNSTLDYISRSTQSGHFVYSTPLYLATNAVNINVVSPSVGSTGGQKLVDNASPIPRDRVFFNYNYFDNTSIVIPGQGAVNVSRITPGFEKTFFNQRMSIEVRVPFATTVDNINLSGLTNTGQILLGNQTTYLKGLLYNNSAWAVSSGFGVQAPTANGVSMQTTIDGAAYNINTNTTQVIPSTFTVVQIQNQAVHILPFLGAVYTPNNRFYAQSVLQFDFDANGNAVSTAAIYPDVTFDANGKISGYSASTTGLRQTGVLNDTNFMYLSGNTGYWMYKVDNPYERGVTGIAPTVELHYNQSLQRSDVVQGPYGNMSSPFNNISNVNGVVGLNMSIGHDKYLSTAYVAPLTTGTNRFFDGELRVMFNYYFGSPRVNPRFSNVPGQ